MAAVGFGFNQSPQGTTIEPIDVTAAASATPVNAVFDAPGPVIDATQPYKATLETNKGDIVINFVTDAPKAVNSFAFLASKGFYDGVAFYYVDHDYLAQAGDPNCRLNSQTICTGFGDPGYTLPLEAGSTKHEQWSVALPQVSQADTVHGSQFRIYFTADERLDGTETVFGKVVQGMDILENQPDLEICSALSQASDTCVDEIPEDALIIENVRIEPA